MQNEDTKEGIIVEDVEVEDFLDHSKEQGLSGQEKRNMGELPTGPRSVEVVFIRHAETEENQKVHSVVSVLKALGEFSLPSWFHFRRALSLIGLNQDSSLSPRGHEQLLHMRDSLSKIVFWQKFSFELCAYSPYSRTKTTAMTLIPPSLHHKCVELDHLREIAPWEHFYSNKLPRRIEDLECWIANSGVDRLVLVGHCKYFQELLNLNAFMWNCDIWKATITFPAPGKRGVATWSEPQLILRSPFAAPHPADSLSLWHLIKSKTSKKIRKERKSYYKSTTPSVTTTSSSSTAQGDGTTSAAAEDEPICRICQAYQSEMPELKLIRPCMCSGSQAFVHPTCLNQWRSTSDAAFQSCSICKYEYQIQRSAIAIVLTNPFFLALWVLVIFLASSFAAGHLLELLAQWRVVPTMTAWRDMAWRITMWGPDKPVQCTLKNMATFRERLTANSNFLLRNLYLMHLSVRCNDDWSWIVGRILAGSSVIGIVGQMLSYVGYIRRLHGQDHGQFVGAVGATFFWFNASDLDGTLRIWMILGWYFVMTSAHRRLLETMRRYAQTWFGDEVLEVE